MPDIRTTLESESRTLAETRKTLGDAMDKLRATEGALVKETGRYRLASEKWRADKDSLEKAKDALAVVLAQIEETETRSLEV